MVTDGVPTYLSRKETVKQQTRMVISRLARVKGAIYRLQPGDLTRQDVRELTKLLNDKTRSNF